MKVSSDLAHITLWWFLFIMGGVLGALAGLELVIPVGLIVVMLLLIVRYFFMIVEERGKWIIIKKK